MKLLVAILSLVLFLSCREDAGNPKQGNTIYYYPTSNIYFDADNNHYIYSDGAKGWSIQKELLPEQEANLGRKVLVTEPAVPVWKANNDHKMVYAAGLYITTEEYRQKFKEDSLNSLPKPTEVYTGYQNEDSTEQKKEKRGVGKFLDRLFGGKDKKKEKKEEEKPEEEDS